MLFDWDAGNANKNLRHNVQDDEIEEAVEDPESKVVGRVFVKGEERFILLGRAASSGKYLRVVFTYRTDRTGAIMVRPISAVEMSTAEKRRYQRR